MGTQENVNTSLYPHVSVDCVLLSIVNNQLCVLLVERKDEHHQSIGYKLPGNLIYTDEDLDAAAARVLYETTRLKKVDLTQFRSFGSLSRTQNKEDIKWLENASRLKIGRIITVAYMALCKGGRVHNTLVNATSSWCPISELPYLPFDHCDIVAAAVRDIRLLIEREPIIIFNYLPAKFTAFQLRRTYEILFNKTLDVRNFHKKMLGMKYVVLTDEIEEAVAHRAARFYKFDKIQYKRLHSRFNY